MSAVAYNALVFYTVLDFVSTICKYKYVNVQAERVKHA